MFVPLFMAGCLDFFSTLAQHPSAVQKFGAPLLALRLLDTLLLWVLFFGRLNATGLPTIPRLRNPRLFLAPSVFSTTDLYTLRFESSCRCLSSSGPFTFHHRTS